MLPNAIEGATRVLAKDQPEYARLAIRDDPTDIGNMMSSKWEPKPEELFGLNCGGKVILSILGERHPPVLLTVSMPDEEMLSLRRRDCDAVVDALMLVPAGPEKEAAAQALRRLFDIPLQWK